MKTLGNLFLLLMLCVGVFGFFRGWFSFSTSGATPNSGKVEVKLTLDPDKAKGDVARAKDKTTELANRAGEKAKPE